MAGNDALLASLLLGQRQRRDPLEIYQSFGRQQAQAGSSTAPLGSGNPLEGIARALQGGIGGLMQGWAIGRQEDQDRNTVSGLSDILGAQNSGEMAERAKAFKGDPNVLASIMGQLVTQRQAQFQNQDKSNQFAAALGGGAPQTPASPGIPQPGYGAATTPGAFSQRALGGFESGNNPQAVNPQSGAGGEFQFLPATWAETRAANPALNLPEAVQQATREQQAAAEQAFRAKNAQALQAAGIQPTPANLYLAHRAGAQGAQAILSASPDTPLSTIVPPIWLQQNPDMRTTAGNFVHMANQRFPAGQEGAPTGTQLAQGDALPGNASGSPVPPSASSGPPDVPRPKPSADQIAKYKGLIASGQMTGAQAVEALDKEVTQQWQMDKTRGLEVWKDQQTSKRQNEKAATELGQKAPMEMITKRVDAYEKEIRPRAEAAVQEINSIHQVRQLLDSGVFTGTGADAQAAGSRLAQALGFDWGADKQANTAALQAAVGNRVLALVKNLGAGTGISNADREYAAKIAGGEISVGEPAMRKILDIGERSARAILKSHDAEASRLKQLPGMAQLGDQQFSVQTAPTYEEWAKANPVQTAPAAAPAAPQPSAPAAPARSGGSIQEGATATNPQTGQKIIFRGGQWVPQ